jgi:hypothetical protein
MTVFDVTVRKTWYGSGKGEIIADIGDKLGQFNFDDDAYSSSWIVPLLANGNLIATLGNVVVKQPLNRLPVGTRVCGVTFVDLGGDKPDLTGMMIGQGVSSRQFELVRV